MGFDHVTINIANDFIDIQTHKWAPWLEVKCKFKVTNIYMFILERVWILISNDPFSKVSLQAHWHGGGIGNGVRHNILLYISMFYATNGFV